MIKYKRTRIAMRTRNAKRQPTNITTRRQMHSARSTTSKLESPEKQEQSPSSELQESKSCLATTIVNKRMKETNSFAKGASESRIADTSQWQKKQLSTRRQSNQPSDADHWFEHRNRIKDKQTRIATQTTIVKGESNIITTR